ncbi:maltose acetyltransferase domain-containing protein [Halorhabdus rudnickae]|uniref:maltose acetyltransferase domain-containing protein n=1 Tax=Halorhabdus rudnickae TaxID=1775544 RepID=UPI001083E55A|nr:maltose acetyltransferase domain-containing protein [Halorhabdus rudnickae]
MASEKQKMLRGELYDASDPELVTERERARELVATYNRTAPDATDDRRALLGELFGSGGEMAHVEAPIRVDYGYNIEVEAGFEANFGCVFLDVRSITFGANCLLGPGVHCYTATHPVDPDARAEGLESGEPITVGENVWIGGQAVLSPGVTVGNGAVIAAGAVVVEDVPARTVVAGNPATVVRELD